ncbi:hypothetical protein [Flavobacterium soyae]|uniref:hypothetical protein n=1 Tax=Flavobacterium soyae TaxID=2903098 RepID=UPI001E2BAD43|nr:hypothetical protein [Flavobacterium soyae]MCD9577350.1 hypothetical protein [Flavobacterium soyae]
MSSIFMINLQMIISFFISLSKIFIVGLFTGILLLFKKLFDKKEYNWVVEYPLSKKQKIIVVSFLIVDIVVVSILSMISRDIYIATYGIAK